VTEGSGDNFFIIKNGEIITPEPRNILRGISRAYIFELAKQLDMKCIEKNIEPYDVMMADEAFMTATPFCMLPVTQLNGINIGQGTPGVLFRKVLACWSQNVGVDIEAQIKKWNLDNPVNKKKSPSPYQFTP
jgi:branched-chain amino acid aminotransferase